MHPLVERFLERPLSQKIGFWVASIAFFCFIYWQYFYKPRYQEYVELKDKIENLNASIANEQRLAASLPKFRKEIKTLEAKLEIALKQLPEQREIPALIDSIAILAKDAGLEVRRIATKSDVVREYYAAVPSELSLRGTYHQIATFYDEVANLSRIVNINNVTMIDPRGVEESAAVKIDSICDVTTFRYLEESERIEIPGKEETKGEKAKKKRGKTGKKTAK